MKNKKIVMTYASKELADAQKYVNKLMGQDDVKVVLKEPVKQAEVVKPTKQKLTEEEKREKHRARSREWVRNNKEKVKIYRERYFEKQRQKRQALKAAAVKAANDKDQQELDALYELGRQADKLYLNKKVKIKNFPCTYKGHVVTKGNNYVTRRISIVNNRLNNIVIKSLNDIVLNE